MTDKTQNDLTLEKPGTLKKDHEAVHEILPADDQQEKVIPTTEGKKKETPLETDPETLPITDPQEDMEGPVSSIMQKIKKNGEANDAESKEEADQKKDKNI